MAQIELIRRGILNSFSTFSKSSSSSWSLWSWMY